MAMVKAAFNKKETIVTSNLNSNVKKKLLKCCVWNIFMVLKLGQLGK
jgi:hypothetical protein